MSAVSERRERERAHRHQLIVTAARELAEAEGWPAVTTRRLADKVEYSQPVLYSHFNGMSGIVTAVALEGFEQLAVQLREAREVASGEALGAVCHAYLGFAEERPAVYDAMFVLPTELKFASEETPPVLRACFDEFVACFPPDHAQRELVAEVVWSAVHGMAVLAGSGRIPPALREERVDILVGRLSDAPTPLTS